MARLKIDHALVVEITGPAQRGDSMTFRLLCADDMLVREQLKRALVRGEPIAVRIETETIDGDV